MDKDDLDHFKTITSALPARRLDSQSKRSVENFSSDLAPAAFCLRRAELMLSCYRKDETHSPEIYSAAIAAVMGEYPESIVAYVTDPRTGLPNTNKFLPNVAEVRTALDVRATEVNRASTYEQRVAEQLRLTDEWRTQVASERLKAAGKAWLDRSDPVAQEVSGEKPKGAPSEEEIESLLTNARETAASINSGKVKLSKESLDMIREREQLSQTMDG